MAIPDEVQQIVAGDLDILILDAGLHALKVVIQHQHLILALPAGDFAAKGAWARTLQVPSQSFFTLGPGVLEPHARLRIMQHPVCLVPHHYSTQDLSLPASCRSQNRSRQAVALLSGAL